MILRFDKTTPLGRPVVPLVYSMTQVSSYPATSRRPANADRRALSAARPSACTLAKDVMRVWSYFRNPRGST